MNSLPLRASCSMVSHRSCTGQHGEKGQHQWARGSMGKGQTSGQRPPSWRTGPRGRAGQGRAGQGRAGQGDVGTPGCCGLHTHSSLCIAPVALASAPCCPRPPPALHPHHPAPTSSGRYSARQDSVACMSAKAWGRLAFGSPGGGDGCRRDQLVGENKQGKARGRFQVGGRRPSIRQAPPARQPHQTDPTTGSRLTPPGAQRTPHEHHPPTSSILVALATFQLRARR